MLRRWLEEPLLDISRIHGRLDAVEELAGGEILRGDLRDQLRGVNDIERLVSRCAAGLAGFRVPSAAPSTLHTSVLPSSHLAQTM